MSMLPRHLNKIQESIVAAAQDANTRFNASINNNSSGSNTNKTTTGKSTTSTTTSTHLKLNLEKHYLYFLNKKSRGIITF